MSTYFNDDKYPSTNSGRMVDGNDNVPLSVLETSQSGVGSARFNQSVSQPIHQYGHHHLHTNQPMVVDSANPGVSSSPTARHRPTDSNAITIVPEKSNEECLEYSAPKVAYVRVPGWKIFPGRNRFFCNGKIIMAKQISVFYFTIVLLVCTCVMFFVYDCPYLTRHISAAIPVVASLLFLFVLFCFFRTSFSDPGIIPRATPEEAADIEQQIVPNQSTSPTYRPPPRTKEVVINNQPIKLKYCFTCKIFRPPRASHCSLCDNCVERFDHHCPWVGNCVGKRNYRFFYMFIVSLALLCIYVFALVITHLFLLTKNSTFVDAVKKSPVSVIECVICFFSIWSILGLAGFHTYLVINNLTTNEDIKGSFSARHNGSRKNPYSQGSAWRNCYAVLCSPWTPSLINTSQYVYCEENMLPQFKKQRQLKNVLPNLSSGYPVQRVPQASTSTANMNFNTNLSAQSINRNQSTDTHSSLFVNNSYDETNFVQYPHSQSDLEHTAYSSQRSIPSQMGASGGATPCNANRMTCQNEPKYSKHLLANERFVTSSYEYVSSPQPCRLHSKRADIAQHYYGSLKNPNAPSMASHDVSGEYQYTGQSSSLKTQAPCSYHSQQQQQSGPFRQGQYSSYAHQSPMPTGERQRSSSNSSKSPSQANYKNSSKQQQRRSSISNSKVDNQSQMTVYK